MIIFLSILTISTRIFFQSKIITQNHILIFCSAYNFVNRSINKGPIRSSFCFRSSHNYKSIIGNSIFGYWCISILTICYCTISQSIKTSSIQRILRNKIQTSRNKFSTYTLQRPRVFNIMSFIYLISYQSCCHILKIGFSSDISCSSLCSS